eukprot:573654-Rhodomonas_salina.2
MGVMSETQVMDMLTALMLADNGSLSLSLPLSVAPTLARLQGLGCCAVEVACEIRLVIGMQGQRGPTPSSRDPSQLRGSPADREHQTSGELVIS